RHPLSRRPRVKSSGIDISLRRTPRHVYSHQRGSSRESLCDGRSIPPEPGLSDEANPALTQLAVTDEIACSVLATIMEEVPENARFRTSDEHAEAVAPIPVGPVPSRLLCRAY